MLFRKPCYLENRVIGEPCKRRTACNCQPVKFFTSLQRENKNLCDLRVKSFHNVLFFVQINLINFETDSTTKLYAVIAIGREWLFSKPIR